MAKDLPLTFWTFSNGNSESGKEEVMIAFAIGLFIGAFVGFLFAAIFAMSRDVDEDAREETISRGFKSRS